VTSLQPRPQYPVATAPDNTLAASPLRGATTTAATSSQNAQNNTNGGAGVGLKYSNLMMTGGGAGSKQGGPSPDNTQLNAKAQQSVRGGGQ
jgi:hypothetical protein